MKSSVLLTLRHRGLVQLGKRSIRRVLAELTRRVRGSAANSGNARPVRMRRMEKIPEDLTLQSGNLDEAALMGFRDYLAHSIVSPEAERELLGYIGEALGRFLYTMCLVPDKPGKLLELGANPYFFTLLLKKFRAYELYLANFFSEQQPYEPGRIYSQEIANQRYGEDHQFKYQIFNIERDQFPHPDETFDVVLFCEILEHLTTDPLSAIKQIHRVLKPGGRLILTTPNVARRQNIEKLLRGENIYDPYSGYGVYGRHNREYTPNELGGAIFKCWFRGRVPDHKGCPS
jgi:SAM-dependent methyltransferase